MRTAGCWLGLAIYLVGVSGLGSPTLNAADIGGSLQVSKDGRRLEQANGEPFFWLGDTAWTLFANLNREEVREYLDTRKRQGFTVIQANVLAWAADDKNRYGNTAFIDRDPAKWNEAYWQHVDFVIEEIVKRDMVIALLPCWARTYIEERHGAEVDKIFTDRPQVAKVYAKKLGERYQAYRNIIWILGGDTWPAQHDVYDALAEGLTEGYGDGDPNGILISFHPKGGTYRPPATSTAEFYHDKPWLDFNMIQSGHALGNRNFERIAADYAKSPIKPTIESEPCYEGHPIKHDFDNGEFAASHVRRRAYWSLLAGGFGFTYGANGVWQFATEDDNHIVEEWFKYTWREALKFEGAGDMIHVRNLFERLHANSAWEPSNTLLTTSPDDIDSHQQAAISDTGQILVYCTSARPVAINAAKTKHDRYSVKWFNPRNGTYRNSAESGRLGEQSTYNPPSETPNEDWLLILTPISRSP